MGKEKQHSGWNGLSARKNCQKEIIRMNGKNNQLNVPQAREAMDKFKMQAASDLDVPVTY